MTGCGSEAQMFDSIPVMEETEAVVVAEGVGLSPMDTETEAAEVKIHVQVDEAGKLVALPLSDIPDFAEQQAVSGHKDQTESHNVVAGAGGDVQNEELLMSGDNNYNDGELMMDCLANIYVAEFVHNGDEIKNDDELCGSPSAEVKVEPQEGSDGVDNEQTATGEVGKTPEIWFDNYVPGTETEEEQDGVGNEQTAIGEVGENPKIWFDNYVPGTTETDGVDNEQTATGEVGKTPKIWFDNYVPGTETEEEQDGVGNEQTATGEVGENPKIWFDNYVPGTTETDGVDNMQTATGEVGKPPKIWFDNYVPGTETEEEQDGVDNEQTATGEVGKNPKIWFDNYVPGSETKEEQAAFLKEVEAFYKENQLEFRHPKFYKEGLNLLKLWNVVKNLGGYKEVTSRKLWKHVGDLFNPPKTCTSVSWTFRHYYEKALLEFEKHKMLTPDPSDGTQAPGSSRATGDAAARAPDNSKVCHPIIKDKSSNSAPNSTRQPKTSGSLKRKRPSAMDCGPGVELQFGTMLNDIGALTYNVKVKVEKTDNSYEVYALIPGFLRDEVNVHAHPDGRVIISGKPKVSDNPWGVTPFKKVVRFPSTIDPSKISAVLTERLQLYVRVPFETSDVSKAI